MVLPDYTMIEKLRFKHSPRYRNCNFLEWKKSKLNPFNLGTVTYLFEIFQIYTLTSSFQSFMDKNRPFQSTQRPQKPPSDKCSAVTSLFRFFSNSHPHPSFQQLRVISVESRPFQATPKTPE